jgi:hypothetical protein
MVSPFTFKQLLLNSTSIPRELKKDSVGIVESTEHFVEQTGILIARAVVQQNSNCIPLRVANFSTEPVVVHIHTIAATTESDRVDEKKHVRMVGATSGSPTALPLMIISLSVVFPPFPPLIFCYT